MEKKDTNSKSQFKFTLNLPRTDFPIRAQAEINDPQMLERWNREKLSEKATIAHEGAEKFILHDGPPYANGYIHLGHAYNKILKDIVTKAQRMSGKEVPVIPGWDCHGLPIELKVTQENPGLDPIALKKKCREYASRWMNVQREEFKNLGVLMDWDHPYLTMSHGYEASTIEAFGKLYGQGYIERKKKTVPWCPSCETVLATAEIEYEDRKDPSIYVLFPLTLDTLSAAVPELHDKDVSLLVWTTTPWTLPLNRAVCLKTGSQYVVLEVNGKYIVVGKDLADDIARLLDVDKKIVATVSAEKFREMAVHHPFIKDFTVPILLEPFVSTDEGTACVHSAPGCGPEDYEIGIRNKLEIFSPLSVDGKYLSGIKPEELKGMRIADGNEWVLKTLSEKGRLLLKKSITHSYPHCWRCYGPLMFRATEQWFLDLSHNNLRDTSLEAIEDIRFIPSRSKNFLKASTSNRLEWCISRQRVWGVAIPALVCELCGCGFTTEEILEKTAKGIEKEGSEFWDTVSIDALQKGVRCPSCDSSQLRKEKDILDVWFEAGISHFAVVLKSPLLQYPANIYLEGVDQHRGWFQSSLLTSMGIEHEAAMRSIVTHGFTVDTDGKKMSKSFGNVTAPNEIVKKLGTDGLRLWASSIDIEGDAIVSDVLLKNVQEVYRRVRNTCRFLLSNLYDFDITKNAVPISEMRALDQYALHQLLEVDAMIRDAYEKIEFTTVFHALGNYCAVQLSSFYLDIIKDRLYTDYPTSISRRSAQTVCWHILDTLTRLMAPVLSFTAESVSDHYQIDKKISIHLQEFADTGKLRDQLPASQEWLKAWEQLREIRSILLKAIEGLRAKGVIKHSLEARVRVLVNTKVMDMAPLKTIEEELAMSGQTLEELLKELLIVSQVEYDELDDEEDDEDADEEDLDEEEGYELTSIDGLLVHVDKVGGDKCPRCWQWEATNHEFRLCKRCQEVVARLRAQK